MAVVTSLSIKYGIYEKEGEVTAELLMVCLAWLSYNHPSVKFYLMQKGLTVCILFIFSVNYVPIIRSEILFWISCRTITDDFSWWEFYIRSREMKSWIDALRYHSQYNQDRLFALEGQYYDLTTLLESVGRDSIEANVQSRKMMKIFDIHISISQASIISHTR